MSCVLTSFHTHTARCKHAIGRDEDYVSHALGAGYQALGFTDHVPWPFDHGYVSPVRMDAGQFGEYAGAIGQLREKYAGRIPIYLGAECEFFPDKLSWLREKKEELGLEYLIMGIHCPPCEEGQIQFAASTREEDLNAYTDLVLAGMESGLYAYVCHPDLPLKSYPFFDRVAENMCEAICREAKKRNLPLEYNLAGLRLRNPSARGHGYTSEEFWEIASAYGCTAVIASDAHEPEVLDRTDMYEAAYQKLSAMKIRVLTDWVEIVHRAGI